MKRAGWLVCLILGGGLGLAASAMSRTLPQESHLAPEGDETQACATGSGEACSCGTGTNRAALLQGKAAAGEAAAGEAALAEQTGAN
jgi:hypothetical protein